MQKGQQHTLPIAVLKQRFGIKYAQGEGRQGRVVAGDTTGLFDLAKRMRKLADEPAWLELVDLHASMKGSAEDRIKYQSTGWDAPQYAQALGMVAGLEQLPALMEAVQILASEVQERMERAEEQTAPQGG